MTKWTGFVCWRTGLNLRRTGLIPRRIKPVLRWIKPVRQLAIKHLAGLGFAILANLIDNFLTVTKLFKNDGLPGTPF